MNLISSFLASSTICLASLVFSLSPSNIGFFAIRISAICASSRMGILGKGGGIAPSSVVKIQLITCSVPVLKTRFVEGVRSIGFFAASSKRYCIRSSGVIALSFAIRAAFSRSSLDTSSTGSALTTFGIEGVTVFTALGCFFSFAGCFSNCGF